MCFLKKFFFKETWKNGLCFSTLLWEIRNWLFLDAVKVIANHKNFPQHRIVIEEFLRNKRKLEFEKRGFFENDCHLVCRRRSAGLLRFTDERKTKWEVISLRYILNECESGISERELRRELLFDLAEKFGHEKSV